jgi:hypothetical protein
MAPARSLADLRPGDLAFGPIRGGAGLLVSAGQLMLGEGFRVGRLDVRHVFVVVEASADIGTFKPSARCVEAEPGGAIESTLRDRWTGDYAYVRLPEDYPGQADDAAAIAKAMIGTPYSFASYAALAAWRFGWKTPRLERWIGRREPLIQIRESLRVNLPREAICSVLADQAWSLTGKRIMEGVAHQCVTPGALAARLLEDDANVWSWPGRVTA